MTGVKRKAPSSSATDNVGDDDDDKKKKEALVAPIVPAIDSPEVIQNRLRHGNGIKGGTRGSLTRCAGLVVNFVKQQQQQTSDTPAATAAAAGATTAEGAATTTTVSRDKVIREFEHLQLEMTKWILTTTRNERELATVQKRITSLQEQTAQQRQVVQQKRAELRQQLHVTACEREYDALAKLAANRHPVSRKVLQQQLSQCQDTIASTQFELRKRQVQTAVRQGQFQLLMQCILDLKQSLNEPLDDVKVPAEASGTNDNDDDGENETSASSKGEAMELDQHEMATEKEDDKDEDLYDDLETI